MTLMVVWYREQYHQLWCAADTRISGANGVATDHGPKIFPVPVVCHVQQGNGNRWRSVRRYSFGFAYCGNNLAATSTHAMATACSQSLASKTRQDNPVSVNAIAELYRCVAENQVRDIAGRAARQPENFFFKAVIFGYCFVQKRFVGFELTPQIGVDGFSMLLTEMLLAPGFFFRTAVVPRNSFGCTMSFENNQITVFCQR